MTERDAEELLFENNYHLEKWTNSTNYVKRLKYKNFTIEDRISLEEIKESKSPLGLIGYRNDKMMEELFEASRKAKN